jgi:hypothetical protein
MFYKDFHLVREGLLQHTEPQLDDIRRRHSGKSVSVADRTGRFRILFRRGLGVARQYPDTFVLEDILKVKTGSSSYYLELFLEGRHNIQQNDT